MDFDYNERKPMLYADLFKPHKNSSEQHSIDHTMMSRSELGSSSSFSSNHSTSFCDSSSSGFSSPFDSELESDDGDFMAELTRQMAEGMLQEEEEIEENKSDSYSVFEETSKNYNTNQRYMDSAPINNLKNGLYPNPISPDDRTPPLQVYNLKNQPPVSKQSVSRAKRFQGTELTQQKQHYVQYRGRDWGVGHGPTGSGMQAVFLGGPGSKSVSTGTGVFLPRVNNNPTELKKKSGCSTVLIPTRVLQALEVHFKRRSDSLGPPLVGGCGSPNHSSPRDESTQSKEEQNGPPQFQDGSTTHEEEMQLPQEWTY